MKKYTKAALVEKNSDSKHEETGDEELLVLASITSK